MCLNILVNEVEKVYTIGRNLILQIKRILCYVLKVLLSRSLLKFSDFVDNTKKDFTQRNFFLKEYFLAVCGFGYIICWILEPTCRQKHSSIGLTKLGSVSRKFIATDFGVYRVCESRRNLGRPWH